jgi:hypothetical protein
MRKNHQKQISELLKTLGEAHIEIKRRLLSGDIPSVMRLLSDCQDGAAQAGNFIEKLEGEGTKTVMLLEEYCESLYRTGLETEYSNENGESAAKRVKKLQARLVAIENSVKTELVPDKIEIAFIPYKASMWDALESVWLAAKDDPSCDAYVIPAPYYDRLTDGSFGRMHYEGGEYPDYVPVTDWRDYDFEERRPDMIFTHNPYDGGNLVTSIHPDFYCERLKIFTDLLVYIPYFVTVDDVPEHFCVCAGTLHADRVIVQSEKIRQTYIRVFKEFEKKNNCKGRFGRAETKFVALGSPKFDKVLSTKREDCDIPAGWRRLIEKPDGTRKHIILYNTSIAAILEGNERYLKKLRSVLDTFREYDDVVLWWRPHPLNEATYGSMRPQLLAEYESLIASYRRAGLGIYDDTPDLHRAVAWTDAYYGDWSSLVVMYGLTGKAMCIQNTYMLSQNHRGLAFESMCDGGEYFWFTSCDFNALFRMDKRTWEAEYMGSFPNERLGALRLYGLIATYNGKLYFAPYYANEIAIYDIASREFEKIALAPVETDRNASYGAEKFYSIKQCGKWIFFIPASYPALLRYDTENGALEYFSEWISPLNKHMAEADSHKIFFADAVIVENKIYAAAWNANAVVVFDTDAYDANIIIVGDKTCRYKSICFDGSVFWLLPRHENAVVMWDSVSSECKEYGLPASCIKKEYGFWSICYASGAVWLFPCQTNSAMKIDVRNGAVSGADVFQAECGYEKTDAEWLESSYIMSKAMGDTIYAHTGKSNRLIEYNCKTGERREQKISQPKEMTVAEDGIRLHDTDAYRTAYDCFYYENEILPLTEFLNRAVRHDGTDSSINYIKAFRERQISIYMKQNTPSGDNAGAAILKYCNTHTKQ